MTTDAGAPKEVLPFEGGELMTGKVALVNNRLKEYCMWTASPAPTVNDPSNIAVLNVAFLQHVAAYLEKPGVRDLSACAMAYVHYAAAALVQNTR